MQDRANRLHQFTRHSPLIIHCLLSRRMRLTLSARQSTMQLNFLLTMLFAIFARAAILPRDQLPLFDLPALSNVDTLDICPELEVTCVLDGDWRHPVGRLGKKRESPLISWWTHQHLDLTSKGISADPSAFCRKGLRCNQCYEEGNTRECNRQFVECGRSCEAYGPIPF